MKMIELHNEGKIYLVNPPEKDISRYIDIDKDKKVYKKPYSIPDRFINFSEPPMNTDMPK